MILSTAIHVFDLLAVGTVPDPDHVLAAAFELDGLQANRESDADLDDAAVWLHAIAIASVLHPPTVDRTRAAYLVAKLRRMQDMVTRPIASTTSGMIR